MRKIVAVSGSFDGEIHKGHLHFLEECRKYGRVFVFLLDDAGIIRQKQRTPIYTQSVRAERLLATGLVDAVVMHGPDQAQNQQMIIQVHPDTYCFGGDQTNDWNKALEVLLRNAGVAVVRIPRFKPELYSTTSLHFGGQHNKHKA